MGPRLTVSVHTVLRSTSGAAGFSLETPIVTAPRQTRPIAPQKSCLRRFSCLNSGRAMSIRQRRMQPSDQNAENGMPLKIMALLLSGICYAEAEMFGRGIGCPLPDTQLLTDQGLRRDIVDVLVRPDPFALCRVLFVSSLLAHKRQPAL